MYKYTRKHTNITNIHSKAQKDAQRNIKIKGQKDKSKNLLETKAIFTQCLQSL